MDFPFFLLDEGGDFVPKDQGFKLMTVMCSDFVNFTYRSEELRKSMTSAYSRIRKRFNITESYICPRNVKTKINDMVTIRMIMCLEHYYMRMTIWGNGNKVKKELKL